MGVVTEAHPPKNTATCWVLSSGQIVSVDTTFTDWFGYRATDVMAASLATVLMDAKSLEQVLRNEEYGPDGLMSVKAARAVSSGLDDNPSVHYQVHAGQFQIPNRQVKHKYTAENIPVDIVLRPANMSTFRYFTIEFHQPVVTSVPPAVPIYDQMILVTDRKGQIRHVSSCLARLLGTTVERLKAALSNNALDNILPEPFAQLHHLYLHGTVPRPAWESPPAYSCPLGYPVCFKTVPSNTIEQIRLVPVSLKLQKQEMGPGDICHAVHVKSLTMDEALDERRLKIIVNGHGIITSVGNSPASLFGFDPNLLIGEPVDNCIDVFRQVSAFVSGVNDSGLNPLGQMLLKLAERTVLTPGTSWRVGFSNPTPLANTHVNLGAITDALLAERCKAATMTLRLQSPPERKSLGDKLMSHQAPGPSLPSNRAISVGWQRVDSSEDGHEKPLLLALEDAVAAEEGKAQDPAAHGPLTLDLFASTLAMEQEKKKPMQSPFAAIPKLKITTAPLPPEPSGLSSTISSISDDSDVIAGLHYELDIWRSDLLTCTVEVDSFCNLVQGNMINPLSPPGLVFGASAFALKGHASILIPQLKGKGISELFSHEGLLATSSTAAAKPSFMSAVKALSSVNRAAKSARKSNFSSHSDGPVMKLNLRHLGDGADIEIRLRAIWTMGSTSKAYILATVVNPANGRSDFISAVLPSLLPTPPPRSSLKEPSLQPPPAVNPSPFKSVVISVGNDGLAKAKETESEVKPTLKAPSKAEKDKNADAKKSKVGGKGKESDPDYVLSDLERLQAEIEAKRNAGKNKPESSPRSSQDDTLADSAESRHGPEKGDAESKQAEQVMATPRQVDLDFDKPAPAKKRIGRCPSNLSATMARVMVMPKMVPLLEEDEGQRHPSSLGHRAPLLMDTLKTSRMDLPLSGKQRVAAWVMNSGQSFDIHGDPVKQVKEARESGLLPMGGGEGLRVRDEAALSEADSGHQYGEGEQEEDYQGRRTVGAASSAGCLARNAMEDLKEFEESDDMEEEEEEQEEEDEEEDKEEHSSGSESPKRRKSGSGDEDEEDDLPFGVHAAPSHSKPSDANLRKRLQEQIQSMIAAKSGAGPSVAIKDGDGGGGGGGRGGDGSIGGDHASHGYSDYNRGKRFRKLIKMLGSATAVATMTRFKQQTLAAVGVLVLLHVAIFAVMLVLLQQLVDNLVNLNSTGETFVASYV